MTRADLVAHQHGAVDPAIVWNALERDLPREAAEVRRILDGHEGRPAGS